METVIDHNVIAELKAIGGTEALFNRVANHFVEKVPSRLAEIEGIAGSQDVGALANAAHALAGHFEPLYKFFLNKWYFDELYNLIFVKPAFWFGRLFWKGGDIGIIDRFGPNGSAAAVGLGSRIAVRMQSGYLYTYALVMLLGLVAAISWFMVQAR